MNRDVSCAANCVTPHASQRPSISGPSLQSEANGTEITMENPPNEPPKPIYLNTKQAADHLGLKPNTLAKMRVYGNGPKYRKHGFRVLYALDDLDAWSNVSARSSTSEQPDG